MKLNGCWDLKLVHEEAHFKPKVWGKLSKQFQLHYDQQEQELLRVLKKQQEYLMLCYLKEYLNLQKNDQELLKRYDQVLDLHDQESE
jgi:hypothetical protein